MALDPCRLLPDASLVQLGGDNLEEIQRIVNTRGGVAFWLFVDALCLLLTLGLGGGSDGRKPTASGNRTGPRRLLCLLHRLGRCLDLGWRRCLLLRQQLRVLRFPRKLRTPLFLFLLFASLCTLGVIFPCIRLLAFLNGSVAVNVIIQLGLPLQIRITFSAAAASCFFASLSAFLARPPSFFAFPPFGGMLVLVVVRSKSVGHV